MKASKGFRSLSPFFEPSLNTLRLYFTINPPDRSGRREKKTDKDEKKESRRGQVVNRPTVRLLVVPL